MRPGELSRYGEVLTSLRELRERGSGTACVGPGTLTFSEGLLLYSFEAITVSYNKLGTPSGFVAHGVNCLDESFCSHAWLTNLHEKLLDNLDSTDPFKLPLKNAVQESVTVLKQNAVRVCCRVQLMSGETALVTGRLYYVNSVEPEFGMRIIGFNLTH